MARTILSLSLAFVLGGGLAAQQTTEAEKPATQKPAANPDAVKQDPAKPAEIDRIDELRSQLARARAELEATRQLVEQGGFPARVVPFVSTRTLSPRVLDLGVDAIPQPPQTEVAPPAKPSGVRLLGDGERELLGPDVIATVDGEPITAAEFEDVLGYYKSLPNADEAGADQAKRDALRALVIQKAALARFPEGAVQAKEKMAEVQGQLEEGAEFAELARTHSQCPSGPSGGDLGFFGRGVMDPMFEIAAFRTKVGQTSGLVQTAFGYHLVKVVAHEKGDAGEDAGERVRASHILVMFDTDQQAVRQSMMQAMNGQVELAFASDDWRKLSPF